MSTEGYIFCFLVCILYCSPSYAKCPKDSIVIRVCGSPGQPSSQLVFNVTRIAGPICLINDGSKCSLNYYQKGSADYDMVIDLYRQFRLQPQHSESSNVRYISLNNIDIIHELELSSHCVGSSPTLNNVNTKNNQAKCSENIIVSSVDLSGLEMAVKFLQWPSLMFIYDTTSEPYISKLQLQLSKYNIISSLLKYDSINCIDIKRKLYDFYMMRKKDDVNFNVILMCSRECTSAILNEANSFDEVYGKQTGFYHNINLLIASPIINSCDLVKSTLLMDNVAFFKDFTCSKIHNNHLQQSMKEIRIVMEEFSRDCFVTDPCYKKTPEEHRKLIVDHLHQYLKDEKEKKRTEIATLIWAADRKRHPNRIGYITHAGLTKMEDDIFPNRKNGLNNKTIIVDTNPWQPFVMKTVINSTVEYSGFCMDILKELSLDLNFSYILREPDDKEWGRIKDGKWTGLIGDLAAERVDLVVAPISISPEREEVMDFTTPYFYEKTGIGLKMPDPNSTKWKRLLQPLSWQVLLCLAISFVAVSIIFTLMEWNNPYYSTVGRNKRFLSTQILTKICYLWGALLSHGGQSVTQSSSGRILIGCWWIFCIIMAATYSGNLIAFLTVNKDKPPISGLDDMLENTDYKWGILGGTVYMTLFQNSKREDYKRIWEGIVKFNETDSRVLSQNTNDHLQLVRGGSYAYLGEYTPMELWQEDNCDIVTINENFFPMLFGLGLPNNSAFTLMFTERLMKIYESGLLRVWKEKWWPKPNTTRCSVSSYAQIKAVDLLSLQSAFYVTAIGLFLSLLSLTLENIVNIKNRDIKIGKWPRRKKKEITK